METKKKNFKDLDDKELITAAAYTAALIKSISIELQNRNHNNQLDKGIYQRFLKDLGWCEFYGNEVIKQTNKILDKMDVKTKKNKEDPIPEWDDGFGS